MNQYTHTLPGHSEGCSFSWGIFTVKSQNIKQGLRASFVLQELPLTFIIPILHTWKSTCDKLASSHDSCDYHKMHITYIWSRKTSNQCFVDNRKWDSATYGHSLLQANGQNTIRSGNSSFEKHQISTSETLVWAWVGSSLTHLFHILLVEKSKLQIDFFLSILKR